MMTGILLVDKPQGPSSFKIVSKIRKKLNVKKVGHAGTLDPMASGLLIVCVGYATRISDLLMSTTKEYEVQAVLGIQTDSYDLEGKILQQRMTNHILREDVQRVMETFVGKHLQQAPLYSAIKLEGRKLYQYARQNIAITPPKREVELFDVQLRSFQNPDFSLYVHCSKGTYVRSLVHDIGEKLNVGACCKHIRRLACDNFKVQDAIQFDDMMNMQADELIKRMMPISAALLAYPQALVDQEQFKKLILGQSVSFKHVNDTPLCLVIDADQKALGLGQVFQGFLKMQKRLWE